METSFSIVQVLVTAGLLVVTFGVSRWIKLEIEKDLGLGVIRSFLQLLAAGFVLDRLFTVNSPLLVLGILLGMVTIGAHTCSRRSTVESGILPRAAVAIGVPGFLSLGILLAVGIIPAGDGDGWMPDLRYLIPIAGIIVGNCMQASSVAYERFSREIVQEQSLVEMALTFGASRYAAVWPAMRNAIRAGLISPIDRMKAMGTVILPGATVGMIIAGADPFQAIFFQLIVVYALLFSQTCAVALAIVLAYPLYFAGPRLRTEYFSQ
jgi:putative ABC transport system permease protein